MIKQIVNEIGLDYQYLELEITESTAMDDVRTSIYKMKNLTNLGIHLAIDDLGTGYSSLSYLKKFSIDALKIDRSFVCDVTTDPNDAAIVTAIIAMAKGLNLKVIAEGVETQEQLAFLQKLNCDEVQGYFFGKPMPAEAFEKLLIRNKKQIL